MEQVRLQARSQVGYLCPVAKTLDSAAPGGAGWTVTPLFTNGSDLVACATRCTSYPASLGRRSNGGKLGCRQVWDEHT